MLANTHFVVFAEASLLEKMSWVAAIVAVVLMVFFFFFTREEFINFLKLYYVRLIISVGLLAAAYVACYRGWFDFAKQYASIPYWMTGALFVSGGIFVFILSLFFSARQKNAQSQMSTGYLENNYRIFALIRKSQQIEGGGIIYRVILNSFFDKKDPNYGLDAVSTTKLALIKNAPLSCYSCGTGNFDGIREGRATFHIERDGRVFRQQTDVLTISAKDPERPMIQRYIFFFEPLPPDNDKYYSLVFQDKLADAMKKLRENQKDSVGFTSRRPGETLDFVVVLLYVPLGHRLLGFAPGNPGRQMTEEELSEYPPPAGFRAYGLKAENVQPNERVYFEVQ
jgi:hypothetical protein